MRNHRVNSFFNELPADERQELIALWNEAGEYHRAATQSFRDDIDTEAALAHVQEELGLSASEIPEKPQHAATESPEPSRASSGRSSAWIYASLAALLLLSAGLFWISQPVRISVAAGETLNVLLPDGSEVMLNSGSELHHNRLFGYTNRDITLSGEGYFEVQASDLPFRVEANGSRTEVMGTSFNLRSWASDPDQVTSLTVNSGRVLFQRTGANHGGVVLDEGFHSELRSGMAGPSEPVSGDISQALAWTRHQLAFAVQPLSVIFAELERKFDLRIQWDDPRIGRSTLTTFYSEPESAEAVLKDICTVKGLSYEQTSTGYRIYF